MVKISVLEGAYNNVFEECTMETAGVITTYYGDHDAFLNHKEMVLAPSASSILIGHGATNTEFLNTRVITAGTITTFVSTPSHSKPMKPAENIETAEISPSTEPGLQESPLRQSVEETGRARGALIDEGREEGPRTYNHKRKRARNSQHPGRRPWRRRRLQ